MKIIDRRNQARGGQRNDRNLNQITHIVVHHTASARTATTATFEQGVWRNQGWDRGGYHEVVLANGDVERNYDDRRIVWGAANQNGHTWHIALVGQHGAGINNITAGQLRSVERRIAEAMRRIGINQVNRVVTHNALPGQATACTSVNISNIRTAVGPLLTPAPPASNVSTHTIRNGDTFWSLSQAWGVAVAEIERANPNVNPKALRVGQVINRPNATTVTPATGTIRVGSRVRVNQNARTWATGQNIASHVLGQTYAVQQMRNNNNELLLAGVLSWIRRADVTLV